MGLYRCYSCTDSRGCPGKMFESQGIPGQAPVCPTCGCGATPREAANILPVVTIHLDVPSGKPGIGLGHAACDSRLKVGMPRMQFTGEPAVVTCVACCRTPAFKLVNSLSEFQIVQDRDFLVLIDRAQGVTKVEE